MAVKETALREVERIGESARASYILDLGADVTKTYSLNNVNPDVVDEDLYDLVSTWAGFSSHTIVQIKKTVTYQIDAA